MPLRRSRPQRCVALAVALPYLSRAVWGPKIHSVAVLPFTAPSGDDSAHLLSGLASDVVRELQRFDLEVKRAPSAAAGADPAVIERRVGTEAVASGCRPLASTGKATLRVAVVHAGASELWSKVYPLENATLPSLARTDFAGRRVRAAGRCPQGRPCAWASGALTPRTTRISAGACCGSSAPETSLKRSLEYFKQAARLDPDYAEPWAGMADAYIALGCSGRSAVCTPLEARRLAKDAAARCPRTRTRTWPRRTRRWRLRRSCTTGTGSVADRASNRRIELNPQYPLAHHWYANFLNEMGRFD